MMRVERFARFGDKLEIREPIKAMVRSDLEATRNRWRENIGAAVILAVGMAGSVAFGVFVGGPMIARGIAALQAGGGW